VTKHWRKCSSVSLTHPTSSLPYLARGRRRPLPPAAAVNASIQEQNTISGMRMQLSPEPNTISGRKVTTMGALVQTKAAISASFKTIEPSQLRMLPAGTIPCREPRSFPQARTPPTMPTTMRDEMLELYAFIFCQGGFRQLGMTFQQFLLAAAAIKPADLSATREYCSLMPERGSL